MATRKGTRGPNTLTGTAGNDLIFGYLGNDTLKGLAGNDRIFGSGGADKLDGGIGNDVLFGGAGADTVIGGAGDDTISGAGGITGSFQVDTAADRLDGGAGNDNITMGKLDTATGGAGKDLLNIVFGTSGASALLNLNFSRAHGASATTFGLGTSKAGGFEGVNCFAFNAFVGSKIVGSRGDDSLGIDLAFGATGAGATISGGAGDDTINGSRLNDILKGDAGSDLINSSSGKDTVTGGTGSDVFEYSIFLNPIADDADRIVDFSRADDVIAFNIAGTSNKFGNEANLLAKGAGIANGTTASGVWQFLYNTTNGQLSLDVNGSDAGGATLIATLANKANITANDISIDYTTVLV
jgi:Ca2+-binding RTX toxin-like protein